MPIRTLKHGRRTKLLALLAVLGIAGAVSGLAMAGASSVAIPRLGSSVHVPAAKAAAMARRMPTAANDTTAAAAPAIETTFVPDPIPAGILGANVPVPIGQSVLVETNGWLVSDGYSLVAVYAGSRGDDPTQGRAVIVRQDLTAGTQAVEIVDAGATGPLTIAASAPTGSAVETSAQTGSLTLNAARGGTVQLNLANTTLSAP